MSHHRVTMSAKQKTKHNQDDIYHMKWDKYPVSANVCGKVKRTGNTCNYYTYSVYEFKCVTCGMMCDSTYETLYVGDEVPQSSLEPKQS